MLYLLQSQAVKYADPNNLNDLNDSISNFCHILRYASNVCWTAAVHSRSAVVVLIHGAEQMG